MSIQLDAQTAHGRLCQALSVLREAECNAVTLFAEIMQRRLFRELGFATIHIYAGEALGFSRSKTYEFIRLAESLDELPELKAGLESGKLSWTKAREVVKVATPKTEKRWIEIAENNSRRELEHQVASSRASRDAAKRDRTQGELLGEPAAAEAAPPKAAPVQSLALRLSPMQRARLDSLVEKLMKRFHCGREELVLMALEAMLIGGEKSTHSDKSSYGEKSTRGDSGTPYQVIVHRCESCGESTVGQERRPLSAAENAQVECDSKVLEPGQRNRQSVPPSLRRAVLLRDGHRCRTQGCGRTSFLEVHHLKPRSKGGGNNMENLITTCSSCHRHLHERGGEVPPLREV